MKGIIIRGVSLTLFFVATLSIPLAAQDTIFSPAEGDHYSLFLQGELSAAEALVARLDAYAELYEEYLHFDRTALPGKLKVKIFASREAYTSYLAEEIGEPKDSFVFLQYTDPALSELVGYNTGTGFESSLVHHAYIQYLKAFIPYPPLWLQKGMAIYLEKSRYLNDEKRAAYNENLDWLKSLKTYISMTEEIIPVSILLTMDVAGANRQIESFYAQSWGLVHFLLNSPKKEYNRVFWDALSGLKPTASRAENEAAVIDKGFAWVNKDLFLADFREYLGGLKTFPELVQEGIAAYSRGETGEAEGLFNKALELRRDHYIPYYYLGLIEYAGRDFTMSDYFYTQALERGAAEGLIYYAKGITAYSAENSAGARDYLEQVIEKDPTGYGTKARELLDQISAEEESGDETGSTGSPETAAPTAPEAESQDEESTESESDSTLPDTAPPEESPEA